MTSPGPAMPRREAAALLGVPETASPSEVQRAYLRAARTTHPDLLPEADEAGRRAAGAAFDGLTRARNVMLGPARPTTIGPPSVWSAGPEGADGPRYRQVEGRGIGGSLVVLVLLAFLLVALVSLQEGLGVGIGTPPPAPPVSVSP